MTRTRTILAIAGLLGVLHIGTTLILGTHGPGPLLSDFIQWTLGWLLIVTINSASRRSEGIARSFWHLAAVAYLLWIIAQSLAVYNDFARTPLIFPLTNLLFSFWFVPMAMAMLLDPEHETGRLDAVMALDFVQGVLVCVAAYLYFFYLPKAENPAELSHSVWAPYFVGYGIVAGAFILRSLLTRSHDARALFGRMGGFLALSGCVDALYHYGPGKDLQTGQWFDLLWSALLITPMAIAETWRQAEAPQIPSESAPHEKKVYSEALFLIYPLLVLFMSLRIARERLGLAALVVLLSFMCSSARLLITQHRLLRTREALRREAARDSLTGLWNRKAIMDIIERELLRAQRGRQSIGLIMIDVDHFKRINDSRGHAAGDAVLRIIASGIAAMVRPYDAVGRYGGEEFLIVAPGCGAAETWELAERVRVHIAGCSINVAGSNVQVSLSLGVATGEDATDLERLLHAADTALYQAKNSGRNRVAPNLARAAASSRESSSGAHRDFWL